MGAPRGLVGRAAIGAVAGAGIRWAVLDSVSGGSLPWGLLLVNTAGCVLIGIAVSGRSAEVAAWLGSGVAGGMTSMSALAVVLAGYLSAGEGTRAAATALLGLCLGVPAFTSGRSLGRAMAGDRPPKAPS